MIGALLCLGTWPAIFNGLERKGRHPVHTFLDYAWTNFLTAVVMALILGEVGSSGNENGPYPSFTTQLRQDNGPSVGFALLGGFFLVLGNLATQYSLAFVGLSVTEVVASSITVVGGTTINFFLDGRINRAEILFPGVFAFLCAAVTGAFLHHSNKADQDKKMGIVRHGANKGQRETGMDVIVPTHGDKDESLEGKYDTARNSGDDTAHGGTLNKASMVAAVKGGGGTAEYLHAVEDNRALKNTKYGPLVGISITCMAGLFYILFSPAFNLATNDQWHVLKKGVPTLVVYTAFFYFSLSFFFFAVVGNLIWLYFPPLGLPKSSIGAYIKDWKLRPWALLAGVVCGLGNGMQFMGGQAAGYAAADSVQALPLVSTFWGVLLFSEYHRSSKKTYTLLVAMLLLFILAVGLLMGSAGTRN